MLANESASCGEGIVFTDELDGISITTFTNQSDVTGNVNLCRAQGNARNGMVYGAVAFTSFDVMDVVFFEANQASQDHVSCFVANSAVRRVHDIVGSVFDKLQGFHSSLAF